MYPEPPCLLTWFAQVWKDPWRPEILRKVEIVIALSPWPNIFLGLQLFMSLCLLPLFVYLWMFSAPPVGHPQTPTFLLVIKWCLQNRFMGTFKTANEMSFKKCKYLVQRQNSIVSRKVNCKNISMQYLIFLFAIKVNKHKN